MTFLKGEPRDDGRLLWTRWDLEGGMRRDEPWHLSFDRNVTLCGRDIETGIRERSLLAKPPVGACADCRAEVARQLGLAVPA